MANRSNFNENTRVQVPAAMHLVRLGYKYLSEIKEEDYDKTSNILTLPLQLALFRLNPGIQAHEVEEFREELIRTLFYFRETQIKFPRIPPSHLSPRLPVANANERTSNNKEQ